MDIFDGEEDSSLLKQALCRAEYQPWALDPSLCVSSQEFGSVLCSRHGRGGDGVERSEVAVQDSGRKKDARQAAVACKLERKSWAGRAVSASGHPSLPSKARWKRGGREGLSVSLSR